MKRIGIAFLVIQAVILIGHIYSNGPGAFSNVASLPIIGVPGIIGVVILIRLRCRNKQSVTK